MTRQDLIEKGYNDVIIFDNTMGYDYDGCIIKITKNKRAVYSYSKMVEFLVEKEGMTEEDAIDWIEYNTIRALNYNQSKYKPIIKYDL